MIYSHLNGQFKKKKIAYEIIISIDFFFFPPPLVLSLTGLMNFFEEKSQQLY